LLKFGLVIGEDKSGPFYNYEVQFYNQNSVQCNKQKYINIPVQCANWRNLPDWYI